jgi:ABC-type uncharacterized transport system substrate-binding protein
MELLHEMVPAAARVAVLGDPTFSLTESLVRDAETAARAKVQVLSASTSREINAAFANFVRERPDVLYVGTSPFFISRRVHGPPLKSTLEDRSQTLPASAITTL